MTKALVLFSGGLDSRLVIKLLQNQKIDIIALNFKFSFGSGCCNTNCSFNFAQTQGIPLKVINCTKGILFKKYLKIVMKPKYGRGVGMNPCIDCRIFILKEAKKIMKKEKADFIATGEVLGERPMSQHRKALEIVEKESGLKGKLLRPLSAKLLPETFAEKKGYVNRNKLLNIKGRSRKKQIELAKKYKISYPNPAGGCLLCEQVFSERLRELFTRKKLKNIEPRDIELLKIGRHFFFQGFKIIVGRNHYENLKLIELKGKDKIFELKNMPGPSILLQGKIDKKSIMKVKELMLKYSKEKDEIVER